LAWLSPSSEIAETSMLPAPACTSSPTPSSCGESRRREDDDILLNFSCSDQLIATDSQTHFRLVAVVMLKCRASVHETLTTLLGLPELNPLCLILMDYLSHTW
jgi:hypothetical protein